MVIGIDASRAFLSSRTGIEEYSYQVIKYLRNELAEERVVLYVRKKNGECGIENGENTKSETISDFELPERWEVRELWGPRVWTQGRLALEMLLHPPDALFVPAHTVPWIHPKRTVVAVHGLEYEFCPEAYSRWERWYMRWSIKHSCRWASKIIAVSENTKRDLISLYGVPEEKIRVIYEGVSNDKFQISNSKINLNEKISKLKTYFLFVGRIETRKNVERMIEAFDLFKKKCGTEHILVLAGKPGYGYDFVKCQMSNVKCQNDIVELGYVSEEEKWELLRGAEGFLFPSLSEGFGLPVLEAQRVGVPVLTSSISSLPEVAGENGAIFVNPESVEDIATGIEKIALDTRLRSAIIEGGLRNVKRFSWEKCAREVGEVLKG